MSEIGSIKQVERAFDHPLQPVRRVPIGWLSRFRDAIGLSPDPYANVNPNQVGREREFGQLLAARLPDPRAEDLIAQGELAETPSDEMIEATLQKGLEARQKEIYDLQLEIIDIQQELKVRTPYNGPQRSPRYINNQ